MDPKDRLHLPHGPQVGTSARLLAVLAALFVACVMIFGAPQSHGGWGNYREFIPRPGSPGEQQVVAEMRRLNFALDTSRASLKR